ncbi:hypothetical protein MRX96_028156 [Rhipicephalus microplus]
MKIVVPRARNRHNKERTARSADRSVRQPDKIQKEQSERMKRSSPVVARCSGTRMSENEFKKRKEKRQEDALDPAGDPRRPASMPLRESAAQWWGECFRETAIASSHRPRCGRAGHAHKPSISSAPRWSLSFDKEMVGSPTRGYHLSLAGAIIERPALYSGDPRRRLEEAGYRHKLTISYTRKKAGSGTLTGFPLQAFRTSEAMKAAAKKERPTSASARLERTASRLLLLLFFIHRTTPRRNDWRYGRRGVIVTTAAASIRKAAQKRGPCGMDGLARTKRQRFSETHRKGHRGNEPQCETLPEDSFRLILARPPPAAGYYYWLGQRRGPQARMCSLTTSEGRDRASQGQQSGGGLPLWPLSETSCQSAASSPLGISRIPAELAFPSFSGVPEKPVRGGRRSVAAVARRTLPLPPQQRACLPRKKETGRQPGARWLAEHPKTARCETRFDRPRFASPPDICPPAAGTTRKVAATTSSKTRARLASSGSEVWFRQNRSTDDTARETAAGERYVRDSGSGRRAPPPDGRRFESAHRCEQAEATTRDGSSGQWRQPPDRPVHVAAAFSGKLLLARGTCQRNFKVAVIRNPCRPTRFAVATRACRPQRTRGSTGTTASALHRAGTANLTVAARVGDYVERSEPGGQECG